VPPSPDEILEQRLRAEAERRDEPIEFVRDAVLRRGLDAARSDREARAVASDIVLVTATPTEHEQLEQAAEELASASRRFPDDILTPIGSASSEPTASSPFA